MALTPNDNGSSQSQPVNFTSRAADRIVSAVRKVEAGSRDQVPFFSQGELLSGKLFRICTFTGAWNKTEAKVVTFRNQTSTPNTASAVNLFANIGAAAAARNCAIARDGTAWYLIAAECS